MATVADSTVTLEVTGMSCASCERHVRQELDQVPGYRNAEIDLVAGRVRVSFESGSATPEQLTEAVARAGYGATVSTLPDDEASSASQTCGCCGRK